MIVSKIDQYPKEFFEQVLLEQGQTSGQKVLSYFEQHHTEFQYLGIYQEGLLGVLVYEEDTCFLRLLIVKSQERNKGYGTELLQKFIELAEEQHFARIETNIPKDQLPFYEKNHFIIKNEDDDSTYVTVEYLAGQQYLGKKVTVTIDHPMGSLHPTIADETYPCNYGYVYDGDIQEAWVVGVEEPLDTFTGIVIGIIYHLETDTSRWIVGKPEMLIQPQKIIDLIGFDEQHYQTRIIWNK